MSHSVASVARVNAKRLWQRIQKGHLQNVSFADLERLVHSFGETLDRQHGSHRVFRHPSVQERLNLQPDKNGQAKPYQIREFLRYVKDYDLGWEG